MLGMRFWSGFASFRNFGKFSEKRLFLLPNEALYQAEPRPDVFIIKYLREYSDSQKKHL